MKPKTMQLLFLFLLISLFSSSKENNNDAKLPCKVSCIRELNSNMQGGPKADAAGETTEYPYGVSPGNYMFNY